VAEYLADIGGGAGVADDEATDAEGRIVVRLEHPGPWLLAATVLRRVDRADLEWQSDFATLTFAVGKP